MTHFCCIVLTLLSYSCCFSCPYQPICAVCQTPCNPTFDRIEVIPGVLPTTPDSYNALAYSYTSTTTATNLGNNAQTITVAFAISQQLTATMTYAEAFQFSEKATLKIGIPFLNDAATLEFSSTQTFTTTTTNTDTKTSTYTTTLTQQIPALTVQEVTAKASAGMITVKVRALVSFCLSACLFVCFFV